MNEEELIIELNKFMEWCKDIDDVWANEFQLWIPEYLDYKRNASQSGVSANG